MANPESAAATALNPAAPPAERYDAQVAVAKSSLRDALIPPAEIQSVIDHIHADFADQELNKALRKNNIIPFPAKNKAGDRGMQSVSLDEFGIVSQGHYWDRPGILNFDSMRTMVDQTPILASIVMTRIRQVQRFCRPQMREADIGFVVRHVDPNVEMTEEQRKTTQLLQHFMLNCGWEFNPRQRKRLKRESLAHFMAKSVRDTLAMDAAPIETEFKRDRKLGLDGFYAIDGSTVRLCSEQGYEGDDEIFAVQVVQGRIRTAYTYDDLVYEVRNPRTDVMACGYGYGETEMLIRVVTYLLNTMTYNGSFFDKNSIPRGILNVYGNYNNDDLAAFRRYWMAMVRGIQNAHNLPVLVSKDQESGANFTEIGAQLSEMAFGKWMSFLTSIACAIYSIAPEEISMESYSAGKSTLSGDDTEERITSSQDKGLRSLLGHYESVFSDFIIQDFSPQYMFRFVGLDSDDAKQRFEMRKLTATWNEARGEQGYTPIEGPLGDAPLNPALMSAWTAERQAEMAKEQEDFGQPPDGDEGEEPLPPEDGENGAKAPEPDFGSPPQGSDGINKGGSATDTFGLSPIFSFEG